MEAKPKSITLDMDSDMERRLVETAPDVRCCRHLSRSSRWVPFFPVASRHRHPASFVAGLSDGIDKSMQSHGMVEVGNPGHSVGRSLY